MLEKTNCEALAKNLARDAISNGTASAEMARKGKRLLETFLEDGRDYLMERSLAYQQAAELMKSEGA